MNKLSNMQRISKILSPNDAGETHSHQAGILIPKDERILSFFPDLNNDVLNPRVHIRFLDESGKPWTFAFIYYNNKKFGGTRDEYRLTRMTPYIKRNALKSEDEIILIHESDSYRIKYARKENILLDENGILRIGSNWKIIEI